MAADVADGERRAKAQGYFHRVTVAVDQAINVAIGGLPDETLSARTKRAAASGNWFARRFLWVLDHTLSRHHGTGAELADLGRAEIVAATEQQALAGQSKAKEQ